MENITHQVTLPHSKALMHVQRKRAWLDLALFLGLPYLQSLIACSMQIWTIEN